MLPVFDYKNVYAQVFWCFFVERLFTCLSIISDRVRSKSKQYRIPWQTCRCFCLQINMFEGELRQADTRTHHKNTALRSVNKRNQFSISFLTRESKNHRHKRWISHSIICCCGFFSQFFRSNSCRWEIVHGSRNDFLSMVNDRIKKSFAVCGSNFI